MDAKRFLADLGMELDKDPGEDGLRDILELLDDPGLIPDILDYVTHQNDRADLKKELTAIKRLSEERTSNKNTRKLICLSTTGAGIAVMVGSFAVIANLATGFFLVPLLVGGVVATHGGIAAFRTAEEERKYQQIADRIKDIESQIAEKFK